MAGLDQEKIIRYVALGAGAVALPAVMGGMAILASIPFLDTVIFQGITVGGVALAALGVGLVDMFVFSSR